VTCARLNHAQQGALEVEAFHHGLDDPVLPAMQTSDDPPNLKKQTGNTSSD
jgi:hypothetical protein